MQNKGTCHWLVLQINLNTTFLVSQAVTVRACYKVTWHTVWFQCQKL